MEIDKIVDRGSLKEWLEGRPPEVAQVLAMRVSLRVLPVFFGRGLGVGSERSDEHNRLILQALRCNLISWAASNYPAHDMRKAAVAAVAAAAAAAATYATVTDLVWESVRSDLDLVEVQSPENLASAPLWPKNVLPDDLEQPPEYRALLDEFRKTEEYRTKHWQLWIEWYENLLTDPPSNWLGEKTTLEIVFKEEEFWDRGVSEVMADLAEIVYHHRLLAVQDGRLGRRWQVGESQFSLVHEDLDEADASVAENRDTLAAHERLVGKVGEFSTIASSIEENYGWSGFSQAWSSYCTALSNLETLESVTIEGLYDATVTLGSFLQLDNDLRSGPDGNASHLSAPHRRAFEDLVRSASPFVRRFPTAQDMDEALGNVLANLQFEAANDLVESAGNVSLITDADRQLIVALLKALENQGPEGERAGKRGFFSVRNLMFATVSLLGGAGVGAAVSDSLKHVDAYNRATRWIGENVDDIVKVAQDLPADQRALLDRVLEDMRNREGGEKAPSRTDGLASSQIRRRRDEDIY